MARRPSAKREVIAYRLDVLNPNLNQNDQQKWLTPEFSFGSKREANEYREKHWPKVTTFRVYAIRFPADLGIPRDFFSNAQLAKSDLKKAA